jgi:hypothetical protein
MMNRNRYTLAEVEASLSRQLQDEAHDQWPQAIKIEAIVNAVRDSDGFWFEERVDDTHTYSTSIFEYALPPGCVSVEDVEMVVSGKLVYVSREAWAVSNGRLRFPRPLPTHSGRNIRVTYIAHNNNVTEVSGSDGVIASSELSSSSSKFVTHGVRRGDPVTVGGSTTYIVSSVISETKLELWGSPVPGSGLSFVVAPDTDLPWEYLVDKSLAFLYEWAARNVPGVDEDNYIRWSSYYRQLAAQEIREKAKRPAARRRY